MRCAGLTDAQLLKFGLFAEGLALTDRALTAMRDLTGAESISSVDYASTSGVILRLEDDVWVNAPVARHNSNFVGMPPFRLDFDDGFFVEGDGLASEAGLWRQPAFHGTSGPDGALNHLVVTHADRARLSPLRSCSMTCDFCNVPFDDPLSSYRLKPVGASIRAIRTALEDPVQPAGHVLISGGTPKPKDTGALLDIFLEILGAFPSVPVDIMNVPLPGLFDWPRLSASSNFREVSINLEIFDRDIARSLMPHKFGRGVPFYLGAIESAVVALGPGRVRSMLLVGLETMDSTLEGVRAVTERGGIAVLSPFRPDPRTPMSSYRPPTRTEMLQVYLRAEDIVSSLGGSLGPGCTPCTHNTLTISGRGGAPVAYSHGQPRLGGVH